MELIAGSSGFNPAVSRPAMDPWGACEKHRLSLTPRPGKLGGRVCILNKLFRWFRFRTLRSQVLTPVTQRGTWQIRPDGD